jgi:hypothetical protein
VTIVRRLANAELASISVIARAILPGVSVAISDLS